MLSISQVVRTTVIRFFPAAATGLIALTAAFVPGSLAEMPLGAWLYLAGILGAQALGFLLVLLHYRPRLEPSAGVTGARSVVVGAFSSALLLAVATGGQAFLPQWGLWLGATLTGAGAAGVMFWPWLRHGRSSGLPPVATPSQLGEARADASRATGRKEKTGPTLNAAI